MTKVQNGRMKIGHLEEKGGVKVKKKSKYEFDKNVLYNYEMPWWKNKIYGTELLGMRLLRKKSLKEMARVTGESIEDLKWMENDKDQPVDPPLAGKYMLYLSCNMNHVHQFRRIVNGEQNEFKESRAIGGRLKKQVYEKYNGQCAKCKSKEKLHIHHIKKYSEGGLNNLDNLVLLCVSCHAEEHKGDPSYYMLKSASERGGANG